MSDHYNDFEHSMIKIVSALYSHYEDHTVIIIILIVVAPYSCCYDHLAFGSAHQSTGS